MVMRRLPKSYEAVMRGTQSEVDTETVSFELKDAKSRSTIVVYFFASEGGSRYSADSLSDSVGVGLRDGEMNELTGDEWHERLVGTLFTPQRYFRSTRIGYRFMMSYEQISGNSAEEVARGLARRVYDGLQRARIVRGS